MKKTSFSVIFLTFLFFGCTQGIRSNDQDPIVEAALKERIEVPESSEPAQYYHRSYAGSYSENLDEEGVSLGMKMDDVLAIWGDPREVDTAGDPRLGNQKWTYLDSITQRWNLKTPKIVYFENGRVIGWENSF